MNNLIGIGGLPGAGKDTVGKIIQYYMAKANCTSPDIYPTLEVFMSGSDLYQEKLSGVDIKKFAFLAKHFVAIATDKEYEEVDSQKFKADKIGGVWGDTTGRKMTSQMMNALRSIRDDFNIVYMEQGWEDVKRFPHNTWVITDVRTKEELNWIHANNGISIYIHREGSGSSEEVVKNETAWHGFKWKITNLSTIDVLAKAHVYPILQAEGLITSETKDVA